MTTSGIEHATLLVVTQYLNQLRNRVPQHAMRMRHIVNCGLLGSTMLFPHYAARATIFEKQKFLNTKCV
jgi:hypothetical protein